MQLGILEKGEVLTCIKVKATFLDEIKAKQFADENLEELRKNTVICKVEKITLDENGVLNFKGRICVPKVDDLIEKLFAVLWFTIFYPPGGD